MLYHMLDEKVGIRRSAIDSYVARINQMKRGLKFSPQAQLRRTQYNKKLQTSFSLSLSVPVSPSLSFPLFFSLSPTSSPLDCFFSEAIAVYVYMSSAFERGHDKTFKTCAVV